MTVVVRRFDFSVTAGNSFVLASLLLLASQNLPNSKSVRAKSTNLPSNTPSVPFKKLQPTYNLHTTWCKVIRKKTHNDSR